MNGSSLDADVSRTCETCKHWDQPEGQRMLSRDPVFEDMKAPLMPRQLLGMKPGDKGYACDWPELGACVPTASIRFRVDVCERWQPKLAVVP